MELNWTRLEAGIYVCGGNMAGWKVAKKVWTKPGIIKGGKQAEGWVVIDPSGTERTSAFPRLLDGKAYVQAESDKLNDDNKVIAYLNPDSLIGSCCTVNLEIDEAPNYTCERMSTAKRVRIYIESRRTMAACETPKLTAKQMRRVRKKANKHGEFIPQMARS